eukprot:5343547-Pyramimonas_sp.AAC.1
MSPDVAHLHGRTARVHAGAVQLAEGEHQVAQQQLQGHVRPPAGGFLPAVRQRAHDRRQRQLRLR